MNRLRLPSPAMFVACTALLVALGGTSYAAVKLPRNSVGTVQLKKNAVTSPKVKNNSLTGADVRESTFARVPSATNALTATTATNATNATNADAAGLLTGFDAKTLVAGYATIAAGATPTVRNFGGKRVTSVAVTRVGAGNYNVTFTGTFPNVTATANVFVLAGTWDSNNFHEAEASMDQGSASATEITVRVFTWTNASQPPVVEDADFSVMVMAP